MMLPRLRLKKEKEVDCIDIDESRLVSIGSGHISIDKIGVITKRQNGEFMGKALYLPDFYEYVIGTESEGYTILVILEKEE